MRLNQVTLGAVDFAESIAFYSRLGLRLIVSSRGQYARFELPGGDATLSVHLTPNVPDDGPVLYFEVENVDATVAQLQTEGIEFATRPEDQPWLWREARLADPAGNQLCIYTAGRNLRFPPWRLK